MQVAHAIAENNMPPIEMPSDTPRTFLHIHKLCLQVDPLARPTFATIHSMLEHESFSPSFKSLSLKRQQQKSSSDSSGPVRFANAPPPPPTTAPPNIPPPARAVTSTPANPPRPANALVEKQPSAAALPTSAPRQSIVPAATPQARHTHGQCCSDCMAAAGAHVAQAAGAVYHAGGGELGPQARHARAAASTRRGARSGLASKHEREWHRRAGSRHAAVDNSDGLMDVDKQRSVAQAKSRLFALKPPGALSESSDTDKMVLPVKIQLGAGEVLLRWVCVFTELWQRVLKSGWLMKQGGGTSLFGRQSWKRRFCHMKDNGIMYYAAAENDMGKKSMGSIDLKQAYNVCAWQHVIWVMGCRCWPARCLTGSSSSRSAASQCPCRIASTSLWRRRRRTPSPGWT